MIGKLMAQVTGLTAVTLMLLFAILLYEHEDLKAAVNDINYSVVESVSTTGIFNTSTYEYLRDSINKFGRFRIQVKLEKRIKQGVYDTFFDSGEEMEEAFKTVSPSSIEVLNRQLQVGDRLGVYLEGREQTRFGKLINSAVFFWMPKQQTAFSIRSFKTAVVSKRTENLVKGYDAISEIKKTQQDVSIAVLVVTKMNPNGKRYGALGHPLVPEVNPIYGDEPDETGNTGINYIFENGDFLKESENFPSQGVQMIKFIQQ